MSAERVEVVALLALGLLVCSWGYWKCRHDAWRLLPKSFLVTGIVYAICLTLELTGVIRR